MSFSPSVFFENLKSRSCSNWAIFSAFSEQREENFSRLALESFSWIFWKRAGLFVVNSCDNLSSFDWVMVSWVSSRSRRSVPWFRDGVPDAVLRPGDSWSPFSKLERRLIAALLAVRDIRSFLSVSLSRSSSAKILYSFAARRGENLASRELEIISNWFYSSGLRSALLIICYKILRPRSVLSYIL